MVQQQIILDTELCFNKQEADFAIGLGITNILGSYAFVVENCRKKERKTLNNKFIELIQEDIADMKKRYTEKKVLNIIQFKKGIPKTREQIEIAIKIITLLFSIDQIKFNFLMIDCFK